MVNEIQTRPVSGWGVLFGMIPVILATIYGGYRVIAAIIEREGAHEPVGMLVFGIILLALALAAEIIVLVGLFTLEPNRAAVLLLFGQYKGTSFREGFQWANPFYSKQKISLRTRNFNTDTIKVNDKRGNPIEIAAVVVWRVADTAQASFAVEDFEDYVHVQSEAAVRNLATHYPYDTNAEDELSLRGSMDEVSATLETELQERLKKAGVVVEETRLSHLAYASEIAGAMLRRQQAEAIVAARTRIVEGAVGMVEMALEQLEQKQTIAMDDERKATMVSNLLVVLCGEQAASPVINAGSLY